MSFPLRLELTHGSVYFTDLGFTVHERNTGNTGRAKFAPEILQLDEIDTEGERIHTDGGFEQFGKLRKEVKVTLPDTSYILIPEGSSVEIYWNHDGSPKHISINPYQHDQLDRYYPKNRQQDGGKRRRVHRRRTQRRRVHRRRTQRRRVHRRRTHRRRHH